MDEGGIAPPSTSTISFYGQFIAASVEKGRNAVIGFQQRAVQKPFDAAERLLMR
jgi:hypothetical protein